MSQKHKCENSNQWAGSITSLTSKAGVPKKDENNNQWTSTLKKSPEVYGDNCHPEKHNQK